MTTYQSVHTGPEVDAAVAVLNDVQEIRDEVEGYKNTVVSLAGQVQTDAGNAAADALTASQAASDALDSKNAAYASEQAASGHASNADSARAQAVVARNGAEDALGEALDAEGRMIQLLSDSEPTIDELRAAIRRINYGDGPYPSLDLNFVGATVLDPRVTFTRASDATYFDAMGVLQTAQPNEPRFEYDPVTGESLGLLIEGQATNLLRNTNDPSVWTSGAGGASVLLNGAVLENIEVIGGIARARIRLPQGQTGRLAFLPGGTVTGIHTARARIRVVEGWKENSLNLTITGSEVFSHIFTPPPLGQWGFIQRTEDINGTGEVNFIRRANTTDPDIVVEVEAQQLEAGPTPTSYIKTEASQVTRTIGTSSISVDDFSFNQDAFTFVVGWALNESGPSASYTPIFKIGNEGNTVFRGIGFRQRRDNWNVYFSVRDDNQPSAGFEMFFIPGVQGRNIAAFSFDRRAGQLRASVNGSAVQSGIFPGEFDEDFLRRIFLTSAGRISGAETPEYYIKRCHYQGLTYFPRALPDAKLVELSTL